MDNQENISNFESREATEASNQLVDLNNGEKNGSAKTLAKIAFETIKIISDSQQQAIIPPRNNIDEIDYRPLLGRTNQLTELEKAKSMHEIISKKMDVVLEATNAGTWQWQAQTNKKTFDKHYALMAGYTEKDIEQFYDNTWEYLTHPEDSKKSDVLFQECVDGKIDEYNLEQRIRHKDGSWIWVKDTVKVAERDENSTALLIYGVSLNITQYKKLESVLESHVEIDSLTGLYNWQYLDKKRQEYDSHRRKFSVSVIDIKVADLVQKNSRFGRKGGDEILVRAARVLSEVFREKDCVARVGGDEFIVLLPDVDPETANNTVGRIKERLSVHNNEFDDSTAISLAIGTATAKKHESLNEALIAADDRMYQDKIQHSK